MTEVPLPTAASSDECTVRIPDRLTRNRSGATLPTLFSLCDKVSFTVPDNRQALPESLAREQPMRGAFPRAGAHRQGRDSSLGVT